MSNIENAIDWLRRVVTQPFDELNRWQRRVRNVYDLARFGARHLTEDNAPQMAAALAYRTLFGLLPVLVVGTVTAKAFLGDRLPDLVRWVVESFGANNFTVHSSESGEVMPMGTWLENLALEASRLNLSALGIIGAAVVVYSAISLMVTIENSFNTIVRAADGRSWLKRIPMYWFVLTVGPILIGITPWLDSRFDFIVAALPTWQWLVTLGHVLWSVTLIWVFMLAMYMLVPNVSVGLRAAMIGALVAAIAIEIGKRFLGAYLANAFSVSRLYGSLGLLPLFMLWVYAMWMVVLFGLEVATLVHALGDRALDRMRDAEAERSRQRGSLVDPASVFTVMEAIASDFESGGVSTLESLSERTGLPEATIGRMVEALVQQGFLHRVTTPRPGLALAQPADRISAEDLIGVGFELADTNVAGQSGGIVGRLRQVQSDFARGRTLEGLTAAVTPPSASGQPAAS